MHPHTINKPLHRFGYINTIRGIAVLGVLLVHVSYQFNTKYLPEILPILFGDGKYGVQLFFFASAFTIFYSYSSRTDESNANRNFFIRRFFRIAPLYYIGIIYYLFQNGLIINFVDGGHLKITLYGILENIFFIHGFNPYYINSVVPGGWSIAVEMMFYCLVPILFRYIKTIDSAIYFLIISLIIRKAVNVLMNHFFIYHIPKSFFDSYIYVYLPNQLPVFAIGILFYFIVQKQKYPRPTALIITSIFLALEICTKIFTLSEHIYLTFTFMLLALGLSKIRKVELTSNVIQYIGKISYSMYLVHFAVLFGLQSIIAPPHVTNSINSLLFFGIEYLLLITLTAAISSLTYRYIEIPFQSLGKKVIKLLSKPLTPPLGAINH